MKYSLIIMCLIGVSVTVQAQSYHELSLNAGGGLSSLQYTPSSGGQKPGFGVNMGVGYRFFFDPQWGIGSGITFATYNAKTRLENYSETTQMRTANVDNPTDFLFSYTYHQYEEKQNAVLLTIPLMAQFQTTGGYTVFYAALGGKIGIPLSARYSARGNYSTEGYFPSTHARYDSLYSYGFGNYALNEEDVRLKLKVSFMLSVETGAKFYVDDWILYVGCYADYGLNDMRKDTRPAPLVGYQPETPWKHAYASVLAMSNKLNTLSAGITVRITFPFIRGSSSGSFNRGMAAPMMGPATNRLRR